MENNLQTILSSKFLDQFQVVDWGYTEDLKASSWENFKSWTENNLHNPLNYLAGERGAKRESLDLYRNGVQSALVFLFSYSKSKKALNQFFTTKESNGLRISSYAFGFGGSDYHEKVKASLNSISLELSKINPEMIYHYSLDTQPVLERDLAYRAGLGWFGKIQC